MEHPAAKKAYRKRQGMVEPVFSYLRTVQGLNRFRRRGPDPGPHRTPRWLGLGDSFTLAIQVEEEATWTATLGEQARLQVLNAGHTPPLLWRAATRTIEAISADGPALGLMDDMEYTVGAPLAMESGDLLLAFTDGLVEARHPDAPDRLFDEPGVRAVLSDCGFGGRSARETVEAVAAAEDQLRYAELKAPFRGVVSVKYVENFETVQANQAIVRLLDVSQIEMVVNARIWVQSNQRVLQLTPASENC